MSGDYIAHCLELLSSLGAMRSCRMFGGHGLYLDDLFIAIVSREGRLYFRVDDQTRPRFEAAGCPPLGYERGGQTKHLPYYGAPEEALDAPEQMRPWAQLAIEAALRVRGAQTAKKTPRKTAKSPAKPRRRSAAPPRP